MCVVPARADRVRQRVLPPPSLAVVLWQRVQPGLEADPEPSNVKQRQGRNGGVFRAS